MKTFKCKFGGGVSCKLNVPDVGPKKGESFAHIVEWDGVLPRKKRRQYIDWMNDVNQLLSDEWNMKFMHVFLFDTDYKDAQVWLYEPGKIPRQPE